MIYLILITVIGLNIAPFVFLLHLDTWQSQEVWAFLGILVCYSWSFFEKPKFTSPKNLSLGLLHLWIGGYTLVIFAVTLKKGSINPEFLKQYVCFFGILMLYKIITEYLTRENFYLMFKFLKYSTIVTLLLCVLQHFGLSQFFTLLHPNYQGGVYINNLVSGFIGNGTHLAGFLGMCIPLFLYEWKREDKLSFILIWIVLLALTGQTKGDVSIGGIVAGICATAYYLFYARRKWFWALVISLVLGLVWTYWKVPSDKYALFLCSQGRIDWWKDYAIASRHMFITGVGLGSVYLTGKNSSFPLHLHFEYLQFLVEIGMVGLVLIIGIIMDFLRVKADNLGLMYKSIFFGFLISAFFNYPMHLWLIAMYGCVAYSASIALGERSV